MAPDGRDFAGRVVIVTGGGSGLGRAAAIGFAARGAQVIVGDLDASSIDGTLALLAPGGHRPGPVDVTVEGAVDDLVATTFAATGRIDVLVNCAGIAEGAGSTIDRPVDSWLRMIDVNLTGTYLMSRAVASRMREQRSGVILTISSIAGVVGLPRRAAYTASKGAVTMLTRALASEWAADGIRVNAVAPGYIRTPMTDVLIAEGRIDADVIIRRTPMGRMGTPDQVADALVFLASDAAAFITGVVLPVDGGYLAHGAPEDA